MKTTKFTTVTETSTDPPTTDIAAPAIGKILRDRWVCDVCRTMSFDEFNEAYLHKKEFL